MREFYIVSSAQTGITAGLEVEDGRVVEAPPVMRWMTGKPLASVLAWLQSKSYQIVQGGEKHGRTDEA